MLQHNLIQKFERRLKAQRFSVNTISNYSSALKIAFKEVKLSGVKALPLELIERYLSTIKLLNLIFRTLIKEMYTHVTKVGKSNVKSPLDTL